MIVKCEWYKIYKRIFNMELNHEKCLLMQEKCTCGGDTHNCDYPIMLAMQLKADATDLRADADREDGKI